MRKDSWVYNTLSVLDRRRRERVALLSVFLVTNEIAFIHELYLVLLLGQERFLLQQRG